MLLLVWTAAKLARTLRRTDGEFQRAKYEPAIALLLSLLMWLVAFLRVDGEWFLMWKSKTWNGQEEASRMFAFMAFCCFT